MGNARSSDSSPVAAAIIVDDGNVLLIHRVIEEGRLSWQILAGKTKPGESADDAAVRETFEGTALAA